MIEAYLRATKQFRDFGDEGQDPQYTQVVTLDLSTITSSLSGPKRPQDRVSLEDMKNDFKHCLVNKVSSFLQY